MQDLRVRDAEHGVRIARVLFAERFADKVRLQEGVKILRPIERVKIYSNKGKSVVVDARIDTGAVRSSLDKKLAEDLGLLEEKNILWKKRYAYRSAGGRQSRPVIGLRISVGGHKINTSASVADRSKLTTPLLIGRNDLQGFFISPVQDGN